MMNQKKILKNDALVDIPFGYKYDDDKKTLVIDEPHANIVRAIIDLRTNYLLEYSEIYYLCINYKTIDEIIYDRIDYVYDTLNDYDSKINNPFIKMDIIKVLKLSENEIKSMILEPLLDTNKKLKFKHSEKYKIISSKINQVIKLIEKRDNLFKQYGDFKNIASTINKYNNFLKRGTIENKAGASLNYKFNYTYTDEYIRFYLENDSVGPIYTDETIEFKKWSAVKLKHVDKIVDDKLDKLVNMCKQIVPNLKIDSYDKVVTKSYAIKVITSKVNEKLSKLENSTEKLNVSIKNWYIKNYPSDELGTTLSPNITFLDLNNLLNSGKGKDIYEFLGCYSDSIIRERCFQKLAELTNKDYSEIYYKWLNKEDIEEELEK